MRKTVGLLLPEVQKLGRRSGTITPYEAGTRRRRFLDATPLCLSRQFGQLLALNCPCFTYLGH